MALSRISSPVLPVTPDRTTDATATALVQLIGQLQSAVQGTYAYRDGGTYYVNTPGSALETITSTSAFQDSTLVKLAVDNCNVGELLEWTVQAVVFGEGTTDNKLRCRVKDDNGYHDPDNPQTLDVQPSIGFPFSLSYRYTVTKAGRNTIVLQGMSNNNDLVLYHYASILARVGALW